MIGGGVTLGEDGVDDAVDAREPFGELVGVGHAVGDAGGGDPLFGAHDALLHRRLGGREGACDLAGRQAGDAAQREGHPGLGCDRRVAAGEDQPEAFVGDVVVERPVELRGRLAQQFLADRSGEPVLSLPSPQPVDRAAAGGGDDPGDRVVGRAVAAPGPKCVDPGVLDRFLGEIEVAELPDEHGDRPAVRLAHRSLDEPSRALLPFVAHGAGPRIAGCCSCTGRISIVPCSAIGIRADTSIA